MTDRRYPAAERERLNKENPDHILWHIHFPFALLMLLAYIQRFDSLVRLVTALISDIFIVT